MHFWTLKECHMSRINPYNQFVGSFIPNWLLRRSEISPGAKLCYARLAQYAGQDGKCFPKQETLAAELAVSVDQAQRYLQELIRCNLVETQRCGLGKANSYFFLSHPWNSTEICSADLRHPEAADMRYQEAVDMRFTDAVDMRCEGRSETPSKGKDSYKRITEKKPDTRSRGLKSDYAARKAFTDLWCAEWQARFGKEYPFAGVRDVKGADILVLTGAPQDEIIQVADWAWLGGAGDWGSSMAVSLAAFAKYFHRLKAQMLAGGGKKGHRMALQASDHEKGW